MAKPQPIDMGKPKREEPVALQIDSYLKNVETYWVINPFFYDKAKIFWLWNKTEFKYEIVDDIDLMNQIDEQLGFYGQTVTSKVKANYIEAFKRVGRKNHPKQAPSKWIQFNDKAYSIKSKNIYQVTHKYFFTNPIPHEIGTDNQTPMMDKLFEEWVGKEYIDDLYSLIAYCCYRKYPIQLLFCLCGSGRNGKTQFMNLLDHFIGAQNVSATELDTLLNSRFESFKLFKKLVCTIGETNFGILTQSSLIKKLVGGDKIGFEKKNKDPFDEYNYAKIIISSNSLPTAEDTSDGFYRRWFIIDFKNEFEETGHDIWKTVPEKEYNSLVKKVTEILPKLLEKGKFENQGTIKQRKRKYIEMSNPLSIFIKEECAVFDEAFILYGRLYTYYVKYLQKHKKRRVKMKEFKTALEDEGFFVEKDNILISGEYKSGYYIKGIKFLDKMDNLDRVSTQSRGVRGEVEVLSKKSKISNQVLNVEFIPVFDTFLPCSHKDCNNSPCCEHPENHKMLCKKHWIDKNDNRQTR